MKVRTLIALLGVCCSSNPFPINHRQLSKGVLFLGPICEDIRRGYAPSGVSLSGTEISALQAAPSTNRDGLNVCNVWPEGDDTILRRNPNYIRSFESDLKEVVVGLNGSYDQLMQCWKSDPARPEFHGEISTIQAKYSPYGWGWKQLSKFSARISSQLQEAATKLMWMAAAQVFAHDLVHGNDLQASGHHWNGRESEDPLDKLQDKRRTLEQMRDTLNEHALSLGSSGVTEARVFWDKFKPVAANMLDVRLATLGNAELGELREQLKKLGADLTLVERGAVKDKTQFESMVVQTKMRAKMMEKYGGKLTEKDKEELKNLKARLAPLEEAIKWKQDKLSKALEIVIPIVMGAVVAGIMYFLYRPKK